MAKKDSGKKITIDKLAKMIKKGFDKTATVEQVKGLEERIDGLESWAKGRFDKVDKDLKIIKERLTNVVYKSDFEKLERRVKYLENILDVPAKKH